MLLTIDVGNTNITFAVFSDGGDNCDNHVFESRIDTNPARMADQYAIILGELLRLYNVDKTLIDGAIIASVVPPVTGQLVAAMETLVGVKPLVVEAGIKTDLSVKLDDLESLVGADLICGAVAAKALYPCPSVVIDLGTVTKVLALDSDGALIGGVLAPGVGISFESMAGKAALLPLVGAAPIEKVIGSNTVDCIRSGILFGAAFMLDGFIERFEAELGGGVGKCSVVATGGFASSVTPYCKRKIEVNDGLVSQGLRFIYEKNQ